MKKNSNYNVGRTIAQEWEKQESESERLATRKKVKAKKIIKVLSLVAVLTIIAVVTVMELSAWLGRKEKIEASKYVPQPTVDIIDESGGGITNKIKEYVGQLEIDLSDIGLALDRAVVPAGKMREVDIYLQGNEEYYIKLNVDRGTAVSAEDTKRMVNYLSEHDLHPHYVDVRVKGKGYYQ
ncbi:hypothetical protein J6S35_01250 [Candidatus Saccharibacteria bacterium]|nr:hypothetical protein [Candidatus Saccharibacteria bacterium]